MSAYSKYFSKMGLTVASCLWPVSSTNRAPARLLILAPIQSGRRNAQTTHVGVFVGNVGAGGTD